VPEPALVSAHFESMPCEKPQSESSAVFVPEVQFVELYWFNAVQVVTARSVQSVAVSLSMLTAFA
jgi:hypothetical protein